MTEREPMVNITSEVASASGRMTPPRWTPELTTSSNTSRLKREGDVFMEGGGQSEIPKGIKAESKQGLKPKAVVDSGYEIVESGAPQDPVEFEKWLARSGSEKISTPELRSHFERFEQRAKKPLSEWSIDELKAQYKEDVLARRRLIATGSFGTREEAIENNTISQIIEGEAENRVKKGEITKEDWEKVRDEAELEAESKGYKMPEGLGPGSPRRREGEEVELVELSDGGIIDPGIKRLIQKYNMMLKSGILTSDKIGEIEIAITQRMSDPGYVIDEAEQDKIFDIFANLNDARRALITRDRREEQVQRQEQRREERKRSGLREKAFEIASEVEEFFEGIRETDGHRKGKFKEDPEFLPQKKELYKKVEDLLKEAPAVDTGSFPHEILGAVRYFKELREGLLSEILFKSFEEPTETGRYEIDLYASSNLNVLLGYLKIEDQDAFKYFFSLKTAADHFHSMNAGILTGNFDEFGRISEKINYQHFANMQQIRGSGLVMRLYEQKYTEYMAREGRISEEGYKDIKKEVEGLFKDMNKSGLVRSEYEDDRIKRGVAKEDAHTMEDWEVSRALGAGRTFFNITLRGAEKIAVGHYPEDRKRFASFPQEAMVRVMNWNEWIIRRFDLGAGKHGQEFLKMVGKRYQEFLRFKGRKLGINRLDKFGGVEVGIIESAGQYNTSGVYSGWRLENMAFKKIYLRDGKTTIQDFMDGESDEGKKFKDELDEFNKKMKARRDSHPNETEANLTTESDQRRYLELMKPLLDRVDIGFGAFVKNKVIGGGGGNGKLGYLVRTEIWRRVAEKNVPVIMEYLANIKYRGDKDTRNILNEIRQEVVPGWNDQGRDAEGLNNWDRFKQKVLISHEIMVKRASMTGEQWEQEEHFYREPDYTAEERALLAKIREQGKKLAPDLADIEFSYTPFMNDMPFGELDYTGPGQEFYKRRTGGDLGGYNKGQQSFTKLVENPGGIGLEEAMKMMKEIIDAISGPEGDRFAQEANFANFEVLMDVTMAESSWKRQALAKELLQAIKHPTSIAQEWAGMDAESIIETEAANYIESAVKAGIISPDLARYMKKKKHATFWYFVWAIMRDVLYITPIVAGVSLASQIRKAA